MPVLFRSGNGPVTALVNAYSAGSTQSNVPVSADEDANTVRVDPPGAFTAGVLQTVINLTGRGRINFLSVYARNTTSRTVRARVTLDGVVIFDATSSAITTNGVGLVVLGVTDTTSTIGQVYQPIDYQESFVLEVASSLSEAATNVGVAVNRETWAS